MRGKMRCHTLRYVTYAKVDDYLRLGWVPLGPAGAGRWSVLMGWMCACNAPVPRAELV